MSNTLCMVKHVLDPRLIKDVEPNPCRFKENKILHKGPQAARPIILGL